MTRSTEAVAWASVKSSGSKVRRRVQQDTLGHRGRKGDPLYGIRRTLQTGGEHLTDKQVARLDPKLAPGTQSTK